MPNEQPELSELKRRLNSLTALSDQLEHVRSATAILLGRGLQLESSVPELSLFQPTTAKDLRHISSAFQHIQQFAQQLRLDGTAQILQVDADERRETTTQDVQAWLVERHGKRSVEQVNTFNTKSIE
jgi:hypothetical protein